MSIKYKYSFPFDEFMAESLADFKFTANLPQPLSIMPVQSAWKTLEKAATVIAANNDGPFHLSDNDFPLLDMKPEVDEYKGNKKGRRNVGKDLAQKKLAGQAYVLKQFIGQDQPPKAIGKKRRARLLSENTEDMKLNVPYSINRNKRWELDSSADYSKNCNSDENVQLSALEKRFSVKGMSPSKDLLAFHQANTEKVLNTRKSQSQRGSTPVELENDVETDEKPSNVRYVIAKAHPGKKGLISAGSLDKGKPLPRSAKRAQLDVSIYSTDNDNEEDDAGLLSPESIAQTEEVAKMYSAPPRHTYNLSDFVTEQKEVVVRQQRSGHVRLDTFVQIEMPDVQEDVDRQSTPNSPVIKLGQTNSLFKTIYVPCQSLNIVSQDDWLQQCASLIDRSDLHFRWLNNVECVFQLDLTSFFMTSKSPHLVMTAAYEKLEQRVRLLLNGSQECQMNMAAIEATLTTKLSGLDAMIQAVVKNVKINASERKEVSIAHSPEFNSSQMAVAVTPLDDNSLLFAPKADGSVVQQNVEDEEDEEDFDFEHVDMSDFIDSDQALDSKWKDSLMDKQIAEMKTLCDQCGENDATKIFLVDECAHSFCGRCLKADLFNQVCENSPDLCCPFKNCTSKVPLPFLLSIFELPVVKSVLRSSAEAKAKQINQKIFSCPTGCGLGFAETRDSKFNQVQCNLCKNHFCLDCHSAPHWPLNCEQNAVWNKKLQAQKQATDDGKNEITQQFFNVWNEAHTRLRDTQSTRKVAKAGQALVGYKLERQLLEIRKASLQLTENGFAWLYLTRNARRQNWHTIKTNLTALFKELNKFESMLLNESLVAEKMEEKIQKLRATMKKVVNEIQQ